jgi:hypothetical protein
MGRLTNGTVVGAVAVLSLLGTGTHAQMDERGSRLGGRRALEMLREAGHDATLDTDSQGDPKIVFYTRGVKCVLLFYDCERGRCGSVQFHAGFATRAGDKPSAHRINEWNRTRRFGKAHLDEERDPIIDYDVEFSGTDAREQFVTAIGRWQSTLSSFRQFFFD